MEKLKDTSDKSLVHLKEAVKFQINILAAHSYKPDEAEREKYLDMCNKVYARYIILNCEKIAQEDPDLQLSSEDMMRFSEAMLNMPIFYIFSTAATMLHKAKAISKDEMFRIVELGVLNYRLSDTDGEDVLLNLSTHVSILLHRKLSQSKHESSNKNDIKKAQKESCIARSEKAAKDHELWKKMAKVELTKNPFLSNGEIASKIQSMIVDNRSEGTIKRVISGVRRELKDSK